MPKLYQIHILPGSEGFTYWLTLQTDQDTIASLSVDQVAIGVPALEAIVDVIHLDGSPYKVDVLNDFV